MKGKKYQENIINYYVLLTIILVISVFIVFYYIVLGIAPTILTAELPNLPLNSNSIYPLLLQGLIIIAGVILGLFGTLFFETLKKLVPSIEENRISSPIKALVYLIVLALGLFIILLTLFSIFYSINAMINYGIVKTYITTQIDANVIHTISTNGTVILINASYINYSITPNTMIKNSTKLLLNSSKNSITSLFEAFTLLVIFIVIYLFAAFGLFDQIKKFSEEGSVSYSVIGFFVIFIALFMLYIVNHYNLFFYLGIGFLVLAIIMLLAVRKKLNPYFENLCKKIRRDNKQNGSSQLDQSDGQKPNLLPPPPSSPV
ncbi:MAG: hypothetical protein M1128_02505 [Candidatus Marsarchaeota archaeon]|nr:hypothetical protein [Candidatus Marsarchaeota archaeon]